MRAKIDINEVEARTKIRAKYLRAIENEEWDLLPGEVYVKSFLRTYGDFLGLDTRELLDDFRRRYERPSDHELRPIAPLGRERERAARGPLVPPWLMIAAVLVIVVAALALIGLSNNKSKPPTVPLNPSAGLTHHARPRARHHRLRHRARHVPPPRPTTVTLQLVPTGLVYVCLTTGSGRQLIPGRDFSAGQTIPVHSAAKLLLTLGNASVKMKVDGKPLPVPASTTSIGYQFDLAGRRPLATAQQPRCT